MAFSATTLLAATADFLETSGFRPVSVDGSFNWGSSHVRLLEDPYCLAAVVVYDTSRELFDRWTDAQGALVEFVAKGLARAEPKTWDIYLVVLTAGFVDDVAARDVSAIRYDTSRVRKLVATGNDLQTLDDVQRLVLPLMPVTQIVLVPPRDVLDELVDALAARSIDRGQVKRVVDAFSANRPLIGALLRSSNED